MQFALLQYDIAWENKSANHALIEQMLFESGVKAGAFVVLPELGDTGFSFNLTKIVDDQTINWGQELARNMKIWLQVGHARLGEEGRGRNCATIITPEGQIAGSYDKIHPFSFGKETEHYQGGEHLLIRRCDDINVCPLICYDLRFPEIWRHGALAGAEVFTIGASWPESRQDHWRALLIARAIENQSYVVGVNRVGVDPNQSYAGGSMIVSPRGLILAEAGQEATVLVGKLDAAKVIDWRAEFPALKDLHGEFLGALRVEKTI